MSLLSVPILARCITRCLLYDASFQPFRYQRLDIIAGCAFIDLIFIKEQFLQFFCVELCSLNVFPKECSRLVHADDAAEVNVLNTLCHDDVLAADGT